MKKSATAARAEPARAPSPADEVDAFTGDPDFMTSLARGLVVIRAFDEAHPRLTVAHASERTGLPRSAVRRCLYTLQCLGYVAVDGSSFVLKPRIVALGHMYLASVPMPIAAQPVLDRVARAVDETCTLAVLDRDEILFVGHSSKAPLVSVNIAVGSRLPAHCTANGQVLLAALSGDELEAYFSRVKLTRATERTLTTRRQLTERLRQVREDGYALVDQEFNMKIRSVAVAIKRLGAVAASMSIAVPTERVGIRDLRSRLLPQLQEAATEFA